MLSLTLLSLRDCRNDERRNRRPRLQSASVDAKPRLGGGVASAGGIVAKTGLQRESPIPPRAARTRLGRRGVAALAVALAALLVLHLRVPDFAETPRNALFDLMLRAAPLTQQAAPGVVVIAIDDESIARIGQWPWPRDMLARLIDGSDAAIIGIVPVLADPDRNSRGGTAARDVLLGATMLHHRVVLASAIAPATPSIAEPPQIGRPVMREIGDAFAPFLAPYPPMLEPVPMLAQAAAGMGIGGISLSRDGIARRVVGIARSGDHLAPGLAVEMLRVAERAPEFVLHAGPAGPRDVQLGRRRVPLDATGHVWVRFATPGLVKLIPAWEILETPRRVAATAGRIAIIGTTAVGLGDSIPTPLGRPLSATEIQAHALAALLAGAAIAHPADLRVVEFALTLMAGLAVMLAASNRRGIWLIASLPLIVVPLLGAAWLMFMSYGVLVDTVSAATAAMALWSVAIGQRLLAEGRALLARERELEAALLKAATADRAKSEFLAKASHELRTPLTAIIGFSEMMDRQLLGPLRPSIYSEYITHVHDSARHLLGIVDDLLDMSLVDLKQLQLQEGDTDIAATLQACLAKIDHRATSKRITLALLTPPDLPRLRADARMVRQMLFHLLGNAIKFSPEATRIELAAAIVDGGMVLAVRDEGPGMSAADIEHALEPFRTLGNPAISSAEGIGLGLSLTRAMIELHGGRLEIVHRGEIGTEMRLCFPAERSLAAA